MNFNRSQIYSYQYLQEIFRFVKMSKLIEVTSIFFTLSTLLGIKINEIYIQRFDEIHHLGELAHQLLLRIGFLDYLLRPFYKRDWIYMGFDKICYVKQRKNCSVKIYPVTNRKLIVDISGLHTNILTTKSQRIKNVSLINKISACTKLVDTQTSLYRCLGQNGIVLLLHSWVEKVFFADKHIAYLTTMRRMVIFEWNFVCSLLSHPKYTYLLFALHPLCVVQWIRRYIDSIAPCRTCKYQRNRNVSFT